MLSRQLQQMQSSKDIPGISCGLVDNNVFEWEVMLMISDDVQLYGGAFSSLYPDCMVKHPGEGKEMLMTDDGVGGFFRALLSFPHEYPHMPPKMKFESPLFHPNSTPPQPLSSASPSFPTHTNKPSLPNRRSLHLDPAPPRRRQIWLRVRRRALVACANARNHSVVCNFDAVVSKRREPGECGGCQVVEGGSEGV